MAELKVIINSAIKRRKDELTNQANVIGVALSSAMSGKPIKLFGDEEEKKKEKTTRENTKKVLDELEDLFN
ncbi:MAG: hypothetical protein ACRDBY_13975 [Cetobacterium sp.]